MSARYTTNALEAAHAMLVKDAMTPKQAAQIYKISLSTAYRVKDEFTPYNNNNKKRLRELLTS